MSQDEETEKDAENSKKVHNILNGIKDDEEQKPAGAAETGPSMNT